MVFPAFNVDNNIVYMWALYPSILLTSWLNTLCVYIIIIYDDQVSYVCNSLFIGMVYPGLK